MTASFTSSQSFVPKVLFTQFAFTTPFEPKIVQQAGAYGINSDGIHFAVIGEYENHTLSSVQKRTLSKVLTGLCKEFELDLMAVYSPPNVPLHERVPAISAHRDVLNDHSEPNAARCPGEQLYQILPELRVEVAANLQQGVGL